MKKILISIVFVCTFINCVFARDYAKLQINEMKNAQKYGTTQKYFSDETSKYDEKSTKVKQDIKDPKLLKFGSEETISSAKYNAKIKQDNIEYAKYAKALTVRTIDNYNARAKGEDYYKIYRIAEKIIRANKLDYVNWRIGIYRDAEDPNAYSTGTNYVAISTALYDAFNNNEDAMAFVIGHEIGHELLGHQQRKVNDIPTLERLSQDKSGIGQTTYFIAAKRYASKSKNMEFAADIEGAKLALKAGYNADKFEDTIRYINAMPHDYADSLSEHPDPKKRIENFKQNRKYFIEDEWKKIGKNNIYHSSVMPVQLSSDRKSIVINSVSDKKNVDNYYKPETADDVYLRFAYKYYINGEFNKSVKYFKKYFKTNTKNAAAYLYASYAYYQLFRTKKSERNLENAKLYANKAYLLDSKNKYIEEQYKLLSEEKIGTI